MFIHGENDGFIPPVHSVNMQKETAGYSEINVIKGAGHAASVLTEPDEYKKILEVFLEKVVG